jgi:hypothetical protein
MAVQGQIGNGGSEAQEPKPCLRHEFSKQLPEPVTDKSCMVARDDSFAPP